MNVLIFPVILSASGYMGLGLWQVALVSVVASTTIALSAIAWRRGGQRRRTRRGIQLAPVMLDHSNWGRASVYRSPLLVCYQDVTGDPSESVIHPKNIQGERMSDSRVRPEAITAFCEARQHIHTFRYSGILSAMDPRTGEYIDDLYTYFGDAQPGGAPAPKYE